MRLTRILIGLGLIFRSIKGWEYTSSLLGTYDPEGVVELMGLHLLEERVEAPPKGAKIILITAL